MASNAASIWDQASDIQGAPPAVGPSIWDQAADIPAPTQPETLTAQKPEMVRPPWHDTGIKPLDDFMRAMDKFNAFTEQATRGATFGLQDKAGAAAAAAPTAARALYGSLTGDKSAPGLEQVSKDYHDELAKERAAGETYAEDHPIASKIATGIGSVAGVGPGGTAEAAPATLGGKVLQSAKGGATVGGLTGFGQSNDESLSKTALDTATGAGGGALIGEAIPIVADKIAQPIIDFAARKFGPNAAENQAVRAITERVKQSAEAGGPTAQDMLDLINAAPNKPLTLADVGGTPVKGLTERIANAPGLGQQVIDKALTARDSGAGLRIAQDVNQGIANGGSTFTTAQALDRARSAAASPLYEEAFKANPSISSPKLDRILQTDAGQDALAGARQRMSNKMALMGTPDPELMEQAREAGQKIEGGNGVASGLKLQTWDQIKQQFDDMIAAKKRAVLSGTARRGEVRDIVDLKNGLVNELDKLDVTAKAGPNSFKPEGGAYVRARSAYSGPSSSIDALEDGTQIFGKHPDEIASDISNLSPGDKEFYKLGAANAIKERIAKTRLGGDEAKNIVGSEWSKSQLKPLFDNASDYDRFINSVTAENTMFNTTRDALGNSRTSRRAAEAEAAKGEGGGLAGAVSQAIAGAATGEPVVSSLGAYNAGKTLLKSLTRPNPQVDLAAARLLVNPDIVANRATLARIIAQQGRPSLTPPVTVPLSTMATGVYPMLTRLNPLGASVPQSASP